MVKSLSFRATFAAFDRPLPAADILHHFFEVSFVPAKIFHLSFQEW